MKCCSFAASRHEGKHNNYESSWNGWTYHQHVWNGCDGVEINEHVWSHMGFGKPMDICDIPWACLKHCALPWSFVTRKSKLHEQAMHKFVWNYITHSKQQVKHPWNPMIMYNTWLNTCEVVCACVRDFLWRLEGPHVDTFLGLVCESVRESMSTYGNMYLYVYVCMCILHYIT